MDVLILAGGRCAPDMQQTSGTTYRALVPFGNLTFLDIISKAVESTGTPIIVAPADAKITGSIPSGVSFIESLSNGLERVGSETFLLCTADLPFVTAESIRGFLNLADPSALLSYPIIEKSLCDQMYPGMKRTTWKLREGEFTGGNVALIRTVLMRQAMPHLTDAYQNRKKVLKLGRQIGIGTVARLLISRVAPRFVPIRALERDVSKMLGAPVRGIVCPYPELGADIDSNEQYLIAKNLRNLP